MRFFAAAVFLCAGVGLGVWGYYLWQQPIRMLPSPPPESRHGAAQDGSGDIRMLPHRPAYLPTSEERRRERQQRKHDWEQAVKWNPACPNLMERGFAIFEAFRVLCRPDNSETPSCDQLRRRYHAASATVTAACQALPYSEARWAREEARRAAERERQRRALASSGTSRHEERRSAPRVLGAPSAIP